MPSNTVNISTQQDLINLVDKADPFRGSVWRGQGSSDWGLIPSLFRPSIDNNLTGLTHTAVSTIQEISKAFGKNITSSQISIASETLILREFYQRADSLGLFSTILDSDNHLYLTQLGKQTGIMNDTIFDRVKHIVAYAQHHGYPTRMLDFSYNPFIALYFAFTSFLRLANYSCTTECPNRFSLYYIKTDDLLLSKTVQLEQIPYGNNKYLYSQQGVFVRAKEYSSTRNNYDLLSISDIDIIKYNISPLLCDTIYHYLCSTRTNAIYLFPDFVGIQRDLEDLKLLYLFERCVR